VYVTRDPVKVAAKSPWGSVTRFSEYVGSIDKRSVGLNRPALRLRAARRPPSLCGAVRPVQDLHDDGHDDELDWRNPHIAIFVDVIGDTGSVEAWQFETGAPSWFKGRTVARTDFEKAIGQRVVLEAVRAKDGTPYGYLYKFTFPDGNTVALR
jgi:Family of unknown function (DUF6152)